MAGEAKPTGNNSLRLWDDDCWEDPRGTGSLPSPDEQFATILAKGGPMKPLDTETELPAEPPTIQHTTCKDWS